MRVCVRRSSCQSVVDAAVDELVEGVIVDAAQMTRYVGLRHLVQVVTAQQLVLARTTVLDLSRLLSLMPQPDVRTRRRQPLQIPRSKKW